MAFIISKIKLENVNVEKVIKFLEHWKEIKDLPCEDIGITKVEDSTLLLEIYYSLEIFDKTVTQFMTIIFRELSFVSALGKVTFIDLQLPDEVYAWFGGPKFGAEEIKKRFDVEDYPVLVAIVKPSLSKELTIDKIKEKIEAVIAGKFHAVKDDEMQGNLSYTSLNDRIELAKTYKKYIPTLNLDSIEDFKKYLSREGSKKIGMVLINASIVGFSMLHEIRKITNVPILSHVALQGVYNSSFSPKVFALLHRLFGCDAFTNPIGDVDYFNITKLQEKEMVLEFTKELPIKKTLPLLTGGARLHNLIDIIKPYEKLKVPYGVVFGSLIFASKEKPKVMCVKTIELLKDFKNKQASDRA